MATAEKTTDDASDLSVRAARELVITLTRLRRQLKEVATAADLTPSQASVASRLSKHGPSSTSALAAAEKVRPQSMAATLAGLDEQGLLVRYPDPDDGRRQLIDLTELARDAIDGTRQARYDWLANELQTRFTTAERGQILTALELLSRLTDR